MKKTLALTLSILLLMSLTAVLGCGNGLTADEKGVEDLTTAFLDNLENEDYEAISKQFDESDPHLMALLYAVGLADASGDSLAIADTKIADTVTIGQDYIEGFFGPDSMYHSLEIVNVSKLTPEHYLVELGLKEKDNIALLIVSKDGDRWGIDLPALIAMGKPEAAQVVVAAATGPAPTDPPTKVYLQDLVEVLEAAKGLRDKLDLWLKPTAKSLLTDERVSEIEEAKKVTLQFDDLLAEAKSAQAGAEEPTHEPVPAPAPEPEPVNPPTIDMTEFNQIQNGMTYEQVVAIIGGPGSVSMEIGAPGEKYHMISYSWDGWKEYSSASISFREGIVSSKIQVGLD